MFSTAANRTMASANAGSIQWPSGGAARPDAALPLEERHAFRVGAIRVYGRRRDVLEVAVKGISAVVLATPGA